MSKVKYLIERFADGETSYFKEIHIGSKYETKWTEDRKDAFNTDSMFLHDVRHYIETYLMDHLPYLSIIICDENFNKIADVPVIEPPLHREELTLRDQFAMSVITGIFTNCNNDGLSYWKLVEEAYEVANLMLLRRKTE